MKVCSIVVLYEPEDQEINNILDYFSSVDKAYILDNSVESRERLVRDTLSKMFESIEDRMEYIHFDHNIGLCKALNYGMKLAMDEDFAWALIMDADSTFNTDVVNIYRKYIASHNCERIGVLAPVHLHDRSMEKSFEGERNVAWAMTSGCFYKTDVFRKFQGFKEELFVDGLDIDYCYKLHRRGYRVVELADARINHLPGETQSVRIAGKEIKYGIASPWRYYMQARSIIWCMLEYHSANEFARYCVKWGKVLLLFEHKKEYMKELLRGTRDGINLWKVSHN